MKKKMTAIAALALVASGCTAQSNIRATVVGDQPTSGSGEPAECVQLEHVWATQEGVWFSGYEGSGTDGWGIYCRSEGWADK